MKVYKPCILLLFTVISMFMSSCSTVSYGNVGVKVDMLGGDKGNVEIVPPGRYWIWGFYTQIFEYPITQYQYPFTKDATEGSELNEEFIFMTREGIQCEADIGVIAYADVKSVDILYKTYKVDMNTLIKKFIRQSIREDLSKYMSKLSVEDIYSGKSNAVMDSITAKLKNDYGKVGLVINSVSLLNNIRFPEDIKKSIIAKITATQEAMKRQNQLAEAEADKQIKIKNAEAEMESNRMKMSQITPQLIEYERVMNQRLFITSYKGAVPQTLVIGGNGAMPFLNLK